MNQGVTCRACHAYICVARTANIRGMSMAKMTVEFNQEISDILSSLSREEGRSKTEILRRAIGLYAWLEKEVSDKDNDKVIAVTDAEGNVSKVINWL